MQEKKHIEELRLCLSLWEKDGYCSFGKRTECKNCAAPYVLWKLITGEVLHDEKNRLMLADWKERLSDIEQRD